MRVLYLTNIPAPYTVDFFNELGEKCDLTVAFEGVVSTERNNAWMNEQIKNFTPIYLKGKRVGADSCFCPGILKVLKKRDWDVFVIGVYSTQTAMLAITYCKLHKIPFWIEVDGGLIHSDSKLRYKLKHWLISSADAWLSSGEATTRYLTHYGALPEKCFQYSFTSLRTRDLERAAAVKRTPRSALREKLGMGENVIVLSVGRFSYKGGYGKGYDVLMRAAEMLDTNIGFYIVGDEPTGEFVRWKQEKHLDNVHFVGFKSKESLGEYYAAADVFVLMTISDVWGLVINEAMSFALPIITTDQCVAGLELVKDGENGFIVPVGDTSSLVQRISDMLDSPEEMKKLGENSLRVIQDYTIEHMAEEHMKYMTEWCAK